MRFGKVTRPILGIKFAPDQSVEQLGVSGVLVLDAPANGPAGKAVLISSPFLFAFLFLYQNTTNLNTSVQGVLIDTHYMQGLRSTKRDAYGRLILGDIITSVDGKKVMNGSDLYRILDQCKVGDKVL